MTQTIPYREGKHFGTLSIDMNDPEDAIFIEQFKRIPSKNRDYIAALYAREKRRGVNRHIGDHIQPLSLTKQIDEPDVQKSRLTIDKNALMETLRRIDEKVQEIQADIDSGKRTKEDADIELKALAAEREKIKGRADELGIKIAALSAKSSADGSSPLKPDQLITIIKKLQEQGNAPDLTPVLNELRNFRIDKANGMNIYISLLIDMIDRTFVYESGRSLGLSNVKNGLEILNKALTGKRITGNKTAARRAINEALGSVMTLYNTPVDNITVKAGIEMEDDVASALFKRLFMTLLIAIDIDVKDIDISHVDNEYIDSRVVAKYLTEIHNAVDETTHLYSGFKQLDVPSETANTYIGIAKNIVTFIRQAASEITKAGGSYVLNICAIVLGIESSNGAEGFNTIYPIRKQLIDAYVKDNVQAAYDAIKTKKQEKNYSKKTIIPTAFNVVRDATAKLVTNLASMQGDISVGYDQKANTLIVNNASIPDVFGYMQTDSSKNVIFANITDDTIIERLKRQYFPKKEATADAPKYVEFETLTNEYKPEPAAPEMTKQPFSLNEPDDETSEAFDRGTMDEKTYIQKRRAKTANEIEQFIESLPYGMNQFADYLDNTWDKVKTGTIGFREEHFVKKPANQGKGIAGYIKVIDRGNPLKRRY